MDQHRLTVGERYRTEFVSELRSVEQQVEVLRQAHEDDDTVKALQDELLCEQQRRSLDNRRLEEMMSRAEDRTRMHEQHSYQLEQRLMQATAVHNTSLAEVQAELEALEATTPRFKKIATPNFGAASLGQGLKTEPIPMETRQSDFSNPAGSCGDCGHANVRGPPPGLGTPMPKAGLSQQTPSAAAASPMPGLKFSTMSGAGYGDYKIKKPVASEGGGGPPDNPGDDFGGDGGPNWNRGRRDRENRERKPTKEDVISKIASRVLPKLEVKNAHDLSAIELTLLWDTWLTKVSHTFNLWSTLAAQTFQQHLKDAQDRHAKWNLMPN
eukprot:2702762-Amphidinium_carterae.1